MKADNTTREQLLNEIAQLRQKNAELELELKRRNSSDTLSRDLNADHPIIYRTRNNQNDFRFVDLVDIHFLDQLMISFYKFTGIPGAIVDVDNSIISEIGWQEICAKFHRTGPETKYCCMQSDMYIAEHLHDGPFVGYCCMNGLMDYSTPIFIEGQHMATIFLGQIFHEPPNEDFFREQAHRNGFDETAYMQALKLVPIIPRKKVEQVMLFYSRLGQLLAAIALERKHQLLKANYDIRDREERLKLVLEASTDGFWDWDIRTGEVTFSENWATLLELTAEEFVPHINSWKALLHPDDSPATLQALTDHLEGKTEKFVSEYRMHTKSGGWRWFQVRGQVVARDEFDEALLMVGAFFDLSERKKSEAALEQSEEKFSKVFHCNPDLMSISTFKNGRYIEINDAFEEVAGYSKEETIGHTAEELNVWPDPHDRELLLDQIMEKRHIRGFELDFRKKGGEIRTVILSGEIIDIDGEPHLLSVIKDITDRKIIEEALRSSEERFSKAFNAAPIPMCISNLSEARFIDINDKFCKVLGFTREDLLGKSSYDLGIWGNLDDRFLIGEKISKMQAINDMEITFHKKSGELRLGLYSAESIMINGETCLLSMLIDITEKKELENEMNRLGQLNLVGEMAASIGHEIRNPMTTVRGFLQILRDNHDYKNEFDYFDIMIEEMDRANMIITEFLSLAKNKVVEKKWENLNSIINILLPLVRANAMILDQTVNLDLHDIPDLFLDSKEINQLILNLIKNAMESMSVGGQVTIQTFCDQTSVVLGVKDQGHGIEREIIEKLGTPFFTTKDQGVGLGLATCYRVASRHNARIDLESDSNGTTFWVSFPIQTNTSQN